MYTETWMEALFLPILTGLGLHAVFKRYEPSLVQFFVTVILAAAGYLALDNHGRKFGGLPTTLNVAAEVALTLLSLSLSVIYYRLFSPWHPLHKIPGPFWARLTQIWLFRKVLNGQVRKDMRRVHERYGDVVRIGPNEVSCAFPEAVMQIHGAKSWIKGKSYNQTASGISTKETSLISLRSHADHAARRKLWDKAFAMQALKDYQPIINARLNQLCEQLDAHARQQKVVDLHHWLGLFVWDVMSDLAYGGGGNMVNTGIDEGGAIHSMLTTLQTAGILKIMPWIAPLFRFSPGRQVMANFRKLATHLFLKRYEDSQKLVGKKDVFHYLLGESKSTGITLTRTELASDSALVIAAGADTTRIVLTTLFAILVEQPARMKELRTAIDDVVGGQDISTLTDVIGKEPLLNAYIQEALRLNPPVPFANQREAPKEGANLQEYSVPEGTQVRVACWTMHRDPRFFRDPEQFLPERWLAKDDDVRAYFPFLHGAYHCVGRNFALQEMRLLIAMILTKYDVTKAPDFDGQKFEDSIEDRGLMEIHSPVDVYLRLREGN